MHVCTIPEARVISRNKSVRCL